MSEVQSYLIRSFREHSVDGFPVLDGKIIDDGLTDMVNEIGKATSRFHPSDIPMLIVALRTELNSLIRMGGDNAVEVADQLQKNITVIDASYIRRRDDND